MGALCGGCARARHGCGEIGFGDGRVGDCSARELIDDAPASEDQHAIAETVELDAVGGGDQHRHALIGKRAQALVDFAARANVDAFGRLVDQEHRRLRRDLASKQRLLLIAAGQFEQLRFDRCGADAQVLRDLPGALDLLGLIDDAGTRDRVQETEPEVLAQRQAEEHAFGVAVVGDEADPGFRETRRDYRLKSPRRGRVLRRRGRGRCRRRRE